MVLACVAEHVSPDEATDAEHRKEYEEDCQVARAPDGDRAADHATPHEDAAAAAGMLLASLVCTVIAFSLIVCCAGAPPCLFVIDGHLGFFGTCSTAALTVAYTVILFFAGRVWWLVAREVSACHSVGSRAVVTAGVVPAVVVTATGVGYHFCTVRALHVQYRRRAQLLANTVPPSALPVFSGLFEDEPLPPGTNIGIAVSAAAAFTAPPPLHVAVVSAPHWDEALIAQAQESRQSGEGGERSAGTGARPVEQEMVVLNPVASSPTANPLLDSLEPSPEPAQLEPPSPRRSEDDQGRADD